MEFIKRNFHVLLLSSNRTMNGSNRICGVWNLTQRKYQYIWNEIMVEVSVYALTVTESGESESKQYRMKEQSCVWALRPIPFIDEIFIVCLLSTDDQSQRFNTTKYDFIMWSMSVHSVSNAMKETLEQVIGVNVRSEIVRDNHFRIWNAVERENELCAGECCDGCYHNIKLVKTMHAGCIESNALFTVDHRPSWVNPSNIIVGTSRARLQTIDNALTGRKCMCFIVCNEIETRTGRVATQTRRCIYLSPCDGTNWMIYWLVNCLLYKIKSEEFLPSHGEREKMRFRFRLDVVKVDGDSTCIWFIGFVDDRQRRHNMDRLCQLW